MRTGGGVTFFYLARFMNEGVRRGAFKALFGWWKSEMRRAEERWFMSYDG
jgi:hypothetical protein